VLFDGTLELSRLESPWTQASAVDHATDLIEEVEPRGFGGIGFTDLVIHIVDVGRVSVVECGGAAVRHLTPFLDRPGIFDVDRGAGFLDDRARREISAERPAVGGVCLSNVDANEFDVLLEALIDLAETPGPGSVRRSGKASENERHGSTPQRRQPRSAIALGGGQIEVRREIADLGRVDVEQFLRGDFLVPELLHSPDRVEHHVPPESVRAVPLLC